jgi:hypothetical protein
MTKKTSLGSLLLAGAAAYGIYKLSKMSSEQRTDLLNKGKKLVSDNLGGLKNGFGGNGSSPDAREARFANDTTYGG